jgi:hypothetical protein
LEKKNDLEKKLDLVTRLDPAKGLDPSYRTRGERGHQGALPTLPQHEQKSATVEVDQLEGAEWVKVSNQWPVERGAAIQKEDCSEC